MTRKKEKLFKDVFVREIAKCKEHLGDLGAETVTTKYAFVDKQDEDLINELIFRVRPKRDDE